MAEHEGRAALRHIDEALGKKPEKDDHAISAATRCLSEYRDRLLAQHRLGEGAEGRQKLEHLNAVISSVLGIHFPLGEVPWPELEKARAWLAALVESEPVSAG